MNTIDDSTKTKVRMEQLVQRYFSPPAASVDFEFGAASHTGLVRSENQDHYLVTRRRKERKVLDSNLPPDFQDTVNEDAFVMAVADGMGGEAFGRLASMLALRVGMSLGADEIKWSTKINQSESVELLEKLDLFFRLLDQEINEQSAANDDLQGMGTTLTVAYTVGVEAFIAHVGDSRAYLIRDGSIEQLTRDHTLANEVLEANMSFETDTQERKMQHVLTNCLGGSRDVDDVDTRQVTLNHGDYLLLCSDGLTDMVDDDTILDNILNHTSCQDAADRLVELALNNGGVDNVTVIIGRFDLPLAQQETRVDS